MCLERREKGTCMSVGSVRRGGGAMVGGWCWMLEFIRPTGGLRRSHTKKQNTGALIELILISCFNTTDEVIF